MSDVAVDCNNYNAYIAEDHSVAMTSSMTSSGGGDCMDQSPFEDKSKFGHFKGSPFFTGAPRRVSHRKGAGLMDANRLLAMESNRLRMDDPWLTHFAGLMTTPMAGYYSAAGMEGFFTGRAGHKRRRIPTSDTVEASESIDNLVSIDDVSIDQLIDTDTSAAYCVLSITKDNASANQNSGSDDVIAPVITIAIPPHTQIIKKHPVRLSDSEESTSSSDDLSPRGSPLTFDPSLAEVYFAYYLPRPVFNPTPLPPREWIALDQSTGNGHPRMSVMCYNVLCDKYATQTQYSYCPSWALGWEYRKAKIMDEIHQYNADILSLQEIETVEFENFFKPSLAKNGYDGIFSPKSRAKTMQEEERKYVDGCAIFWKRDKFSFDQEHLIEFTQLAIAYAEGSDLMLNRVMTRDNIALAAVLTIKSSIFGEDPVPSGWKERPLLVCTAHIHWDPEFCDVKLIQSMMLLQEISRIRRDVGPDTPLLLCGDLNSLPDSGVYELLSSGRVSVSHPDFRSFVKDPCLNKMTPSEHGFFSHSLDLASAYDPDTMPFTNYTYDFRGVIDYVFASRPQLRRTGVLGPLDQSWFRLNKVSGCPHPLIPSDHVPLLAEFSLL